MRRTVRPFVREFKNRSPKSSRHPTPVAIDHETKPSLFDFGDVAPRLDDHDDGYEAALKAADAVFGKKIGAAPALAPSGESPPPPPVGRVLPSLIETPDAAPQRRDTEKKARKPRAPRVKKAEEPAAPSRRGRPPRQPKDATPSLPIERPAVKIAAPAPKAFIPAQAPKIFAPRRTRRPIQLRWVLQTELKAGEKWKRRLPEAAR